LSKRIVSLVPSSTETLLALGADVVACSKYCEQPDLAHVGGTKNPDIAAIVALAPDLVVLDREENRIEDHDALVAACITVFVSDVTDVSSGLAVVGQLCEAADVENPESDWYFPDFSGTRRTAFVPIWRRPWMAISAATYGASLLSALGVDVVSFGDAAYPTVELSEVAAANPDLVLVPSEPYEFGDEHLIELAEAVPNAAVLRIDGQDLFWWGTRTPDALSRMARELAPPPTL
jgi:ABC-type hemin transport system substrate-binding protein